MTTIDLAPSRPEDVRRRNLGVLLTHVHRQGAQSRAELTRRVGLNRSTVGTLVAELSQAGVLAETVPTKGAGVGRPSFVVGRRADGPYVLAVDIDVHELVVAAVGLGGVVLDRWTVAYPPGPVTPDGVVELIGRAYRSIVAGPAAAGWMAGVGVSVPGSVRRSDGRIMVAPNLQWRDVVLDAPIAAELGRAGSVQVANDADLGALAEHLRGTARGIDDVLFIVGRVGVGGGIIAGGSPLHGARGLAGEVGHLVVDPNGLLCHCGNYGCLETVVGEDALIRMSGRGAASSTSRIVEIVRCAERGEPRALDTVRSVSHWLGRGLASIANVLNPAVIVLGGYLTVLYDAHADLIRAAFEANMHAAPAEGIEIRRCGLGRDFALLGAAEIAFGELLDNPIEVASRR